MSTHGEVDKAKGTIKEGAGNLTGDKQTEGEGKLDKLKGDAENLASDVKDKLSDAKDKVSETMKKASH